MDSTIILTKVELKNLRLTPFYFSRLEGYSGPWRGQVMSKLKAWMSRSFEIEWKLAKKGPTDTPRQRPEERRCKGARGQSLDPLLPKPPRAHFLSPPVLFLDSSSHLLTTPPPAITPSHCHDLLEWVSVLTWGKWMFHIYKMVLFLVWF